MRSLHTSTPVETKPSRSRHNCNQHCGNDRADLRRLQGPSLRAVLPGKVFVHPPSQNNYLGRTTTSYTRAHKLLFSVVMLPFISCMCTLLKCYVLVYSKLGLQSIRIPSHKQQQWLLSRTFMYNTIYCTKTTTLFGTFRNGRLISKTCSNAVHVPQDIGRIHVRKQIKTLTFRKPDFSHNAK